MRIEIQKSADGKKVRAIVTDDALNISFRSVWLPFGEVEHLLPWQIKRKRAYTSKDYVRSPASEIKATPVRRMCLSCERHFTSGGIHNRLCNLCKHKGEF